MILQSFFFSMEAFELIELNFDNNEKLTISSDSAKKIPALRVMSGMAGLAFN